MRENEERSSSLDRAARRAPGRVRALAAYRRSGWLAVLVAVVAIGLTACGGPSSPSVANVGASNGDGGSAATTGSDNNAAQSLIEWANCMRGHGDPDQADPTIDTHGVINITIPGNAASLSNAVHNGTAPCNSYLAAASNALQAGKANLQPPNQAALVRFSRCMRANGVPNYPDPGTGGTTNFQSTGIDPNSPFVQRATNLCGQRIDAPSWWISGTGPPGDITVRSGPARNDGPVPHRGGLVPSAAIRDSPATPVSGS